MLGIVWIDGIKRFSKPLKL